MAKPDLLAVRVRAGMGVCLDQIAGGDPYAYFSEEMGHGDHSPFGINGLEAKPDGKVYVLGHSSNVGPPALRQYDGDGNYLRTIFPPPAGKPLKAIDSWGIIGKPDGAYTPKFTRLTFPCLTTTFINTGDGGMARLWPTPDKDRLTVWCTKLGKGGFDLLTINSDGTIPMDAADRLPGPLIRTPPIEEGPVKPDSNLCDSLLGPMFTCFTPDHNYFYLSGVYAATNIYGSVKEIKTTGFWRGGHLCGGPGESQTVANAEDVFIGFRGSLRICIRQRRSPRQDVGVPVQSGKQPLTIGDAKRRRGSNPAIIHRGPNLPVSARAIDALDPVLLGGRPGMSITSAAMIWADSRRLPSIAGLPIIWAIWLTSACLAASFASRSSSWDSRT